MQPAAVVFSKDRPLQLTAYLESLVFCTGIEPERIHVLVPEFGPYVPVMHRFPRVFWHAEAVHGSFDAALAHIIGRAIGDTLYILFGCDDVVYTRSTNLSVVCDHLGARPEVLGFSLRLGLNIAGRPEPADDGDRLFYQWRWPGRPSHWGYPFELMASVYRTAFVRAVLSACARPFATPSFLEWLGVSYVRESYRDRQPVLSMFRTPSHAVGQDVNRVQREFPNSTHGTPAQSVASLAQQYAQGARLDWSRLYGIEPADVFVGDKYWQLVGPRVRVDGPDTSAAGL